MVRCLPKPFSDFDTFKSPAHTTCSSKHYIGDFREEASSKLKACCHAATDVHIRKRPGRHVFGMRATVRIIRTPIRYCFIQLWKNLSPKNTSLVTRYDGAVRGRIFDLFKNQPLESRISHLLRHLLPKVLLRSTSIKPMLFHPSSNSRGVVKARRIQLVASQEHEVVLKDASHLVQKSCQNGIKLGARWIQRIGASA